MTAPAPASEQDSSRPRYARFIWQGRFLPAFWTIASVLSLTVNIILIVVILALLSQLFAIRDLVNSQLISGLHTNFLKMDQASITTTIQVNDTIVVKDTIPVVFDLPLQQETRAVLTKDAYLPKGQVLLNGTWVTTDIRLKRGTPLDIYLDIVVPVNTTIPVELNVPVQLNVPVDIPLNQTELHEPFVGLQAVVEPYKELLDQTPKSWADLLCPNWLCPPEQP